MFGRQALPPRDAVDVFVVFSHGQAPVREPVTLPIPIRGGMVFASLPVYRFIPSGVSGAVVSAGDERMETSTVCDVDAMAARNLLDRFPLLFAKQVARSYLKARSVSAMERHHGAAGALLGVLFSAVTEQADLRTWSMLPKQVQTARLFVPPHTPAVTLHAAPGGPQATVPIPPARAPPRQLQVQDAGLASHEMVLNGTGGYLKSTTSFSRSAVACAACAAPPPMSCTSRRAGRCRLHEDRDQRP
jgi:hypothetical protein